MSEHQIARFAVERLAGHLSAVAAGSIRREDDPAAEHLRHLVSNAVPIGVWQPFENAPGDPAHREPLGGELAGALARDPGLAQQIQSAQQPRFAPVGAPVSGAPPTQPSTQWVARVASGRNPLVVIGGIVAAFMLLAGIVLGVNAVFGSSPEEDAESTARDFLLAALAEDKADACGLSTGALHTMMGCGGSHKPSTLASNEELRSLFDQNTEITARLIGDEAATATCQGRWGREDLQRFAKIIGEDAAEISDEELEDSCGRLRLQKVGDRWLVTSIQK